MLKSCKSVHVARLLLAATCTITIVGVLSGSESRTWTYQGKLRFDAEYAGNEGSLVVLKNPDGQVIKIEAANLSTADRQYVAGKGAPHGGRECQPASQATVTSCLAQLMSGPRRVNRPSSINVGLWVATPLTAQDILQLQHLAKSAPDADGRVLAMTIHDRKLREHLSEISRRSHSPVTIHSDGREMLNRDEVHVVVFVGLLNGSELTIPELPDVRSNSRILNTLVGWSCQKGKDILVLEGSVNWHSETVEGEDDSETPGICARKFERIAWYTQLSDIRDARAYYAAVRTRSPGARQIGVDASAQVGHRGGPGTVTGRGARSRRYSDYQQGLLRVLSGGNR